MMKTRIKVAMIAIVSQAAAARAEEARPIAVDISVEAADSALSLKAAAISKAIEDGDNLAADGLLNDLYTARAGKEGKEETPVQARPRCQCGHNGTSVAGEQTPSSQTPATPPVVLPLSPSDEAFVDAFIRDQKAQQAEAEAKADEVKAKEKKEKAEEAAKKEKAVKWGVSIMTVALLLLILL
jgi:hypothetical protein